MAKHHNIFNEQIAEEAAAWFVDFSVGDVEPGHLAQFNQWLRTSPMHVRAYLQVAAFWEEAELLKLDAAELEALAQQIASGGTIIPLRPAAAKSATSNEASPAASSDATRRGARRWLAVAAAAVLCVCIGALTWLRPDAGVSYATEIGEQRSVTLSDGSVVQLNSQSRLDVRFSRTVRNVELVEGQALFEVAKNPDRPFVVASGSTSVRAVGTQFDVYRKATGTVVTVLEGRVAVSSKGARLDLQPAVSMSDASPGKPARQDGSNALLLSAGEQIVVTKAAILPPQRTNVEAVTAWTQKKLVFESVPLSEVVSEFNRYNRRRILVEDATLNDVHVSGVFAATSVDHLVEFLQTRFATDVKMQDDEIRISRRP